MPASGVHKHSNGNGLVADSATVDAAAWVGPDAMVLGSARIFGQARIEDFAVVEIDPGTQIVTLRSDKDGSSWLLNVSP